MKLLWCHPESIQCFLQYPKPSVTSDGPRGPKYHFVIVNRCVKKCLHELYQTRVPTPSVCLRQQNPDYRWAGRRHIQVVSFGVRKILRTQSGFHSIVSLFLDHQSRINHLETLFLDLLVTDFLIDSEILESLHLFPNTQFNCSRIHSLILCQFQDRCHVQIVYLDFFGVVLDVILFL